MCSWPVPPAMRRAVHLIVVAILKPFIKSAQDGKFGVGALIVSVYRILLSSRINASTLNF